MAEYGVLNPNIGKDFPEIEKPKRGRPRLMDPRYEREIMRRFVLENEPCTNRTVQNRYYHGHALGTLKDAGTFSDPKFAWLLRPDEHGQTHIRLSISEQLGRTRCPIALKIFAEELCRLRPTASEAISLIRRWRDWQETFAAIHYLKNENIEFTDEQMESIARKTVKRQRRKKSRIDSRCQQQLRKV
jgi:hypothetical protein